MLTSLKAILRGAARSLGVERAANTALIEEMWPEIVGPVAAGHSRVVGVRGTIVLAETEAGPLIQDLSAQRGRYVTEINRRLGGQAVTDIRFRPAGRSFQAGRVGGGGPQGEADGRLVSGAPGGEAEEQGPSLSAAEVAAIERAVVEIRDPEIREGARRAMISQLRWRRRREAQTGRQ
jgi:hypothetical protein